MSPIPLWTDHWDAIVAQFIGRPRLLIACDFDGTLAPIVDRPEKAALQGEVRGLLRKLQAMSGVTVAVISGRAVGDLRLRVGIDGVLYGGNHGLEIDAPGIRWASTDARAHRPELASAVAELRSRTAGIEGVLIEDKHLTATVHWRLAPPDRLPELWAIVEGIVREYTGLKITDGKAIWELRPRVEWDKGSAVQHFLARLNLTPEDAIYLGDDDTDEAAFRVLPLGLTLRVGETSDSVAKYRLRDQEAAIAFLFCVFGARMAARQAPLTAAKLARPNGTSKTLAA